MKLENAYFAGGCFWGMQELLRKLPGVIETQVGYMGGSARNPTYEIVKEGESGHAETVFVLFDPLVIRFSELVSYFFKIHDPTTPNRQGNDRGSSYRSAVFCVSVDQKQVVREIIEKMNASGRWPGHIMTEVKDAETFYPAEDFHQDYLQHNPHGYTCHFERPDWEIGR